MMVSFADRIWGSPETSLTPISPMAARVGITSIFRMLRLLFTIDGSYSSTTHEDIYPVHTPATIAIEASILNVHSTTRA